VLDHCCECTLNAGANAVAVHLDSDEITYSYTDANGVVELSLREKIADVDFITSLWEHSINRCLAISAELPYEIQCVSEQLARSLVALEESFEDAMLSAQNTGRDVEALVRSQTAFVESRTADCEIEVTLSYHDFDENEAYQKCVFDYTNQRNKFLFFYSRY